MKTKFNKKNTIAGTYRQHSSGDYGFVDLKDSQKGYYVFFKNKKDALDGDEVLAEVKIFKGREEAIIKRIIKRTEKILIGKFSLAKKGDSKIAGFGFVILRDKSFGKDIFIAGKYINNAKENDLVGVKIINWSGKNPEGKIVNVLGRYSDKKLIVDSYILESGFHYYFPREIEKELSKYKEIVIKKDYKKRKDLTNLFTFTVDSRDAKDLDDAISITEKENGEFVLYVHIADVSHYVREGSIIDMEAKNRGTSVYLVDRVLAMLPEKLSNKLCSLNQNENKLTLTCEMHISKSGALIKSKVYESIIESNYRLTYKLLDDFKNGKIEDLNNYDDFILFNKDVSIDEISEIKEKIDLSYKLKDIISKYKNLNGVLSFDFAETKIKINQNYEVEKIEKYRIYESNKIIEEFMIMANESISKMYSSLPFLYRIHEKPSKEDMQGLAMFLKRFGIDFDMKIGNTKEFANLLELIDNIGKNKLVFEKFILKSLAKAIYSDKNSGHFGLGLKYYSHFTSPIRRYPDLQIHRIIKEKLSGKLDKKRIMHYKDILSDVALRSSDMERKADELEYKVRDYFIVNYYKDKLGETFNSTIVGMISKGIFVELKDSAEGFVEMPFGSIYKEELFEFEDKKNKKMYNLGDELKVKLVEADESLLRLNFEIV